MKKYIFIVPSLSKGGAEKVVSILANNLVNNNREVTIITHYYTDNDYDIDTRVKKICLSGLEEVEYRKKITILYLLKLIIKLRKTITKENSDYIIPFLVNTCIRTDLALMLSREKKKVIQTIRNNPNIYPKNKVLKIYRDFLVKRYKKTIVQNKEQMEYFNKNKSSKIYILNNPIDNRINDVKRNSNKNKIIIIGVGRLEPQKNFSLLINAFSKISKKFPNTILKIYGEGELKNQLTDEIIKKGIKDKAFLMGRKTSYNEMYGEANIFVLSSNAEGMPNALLEAMGVGIPCVSTNCPTGPNEIIDNYKNGILVPTNDLEGMENAIIELVTDEELRKKIGKEAKETVQKKYSADIICNTLMDICEK